MEMLQFDRSAYTAMQARLARSDGRQISLNEYTAAGLFALSVDFSDAMDSLCARERIEDLQQLSAWIDLASAGEEYNLTPAGIWAGLQECAARGMLTVAVNIEDPEQVFVQLAADPATTRNGGAMSRLRTAVTLLRLGRAEVMPAQAARTHRERIWRLKAWGGVIPGPGEEAEKAQMAGRQGGRAAGRQGGRMRERRGFRNRNLLDFLCAVAAVQEAPEVPLAHAAGLDPFGLDMAVGMALRQGFIHLVAPGRYIVTRQGIGWATGQLAQARAMLALESRALRPERPRLEMTKRPHGGRPEVLIPAPM